MAIADMRWRIVAAAFLAISIGCAAFFMKGSRPHRGVPAAPLGTFTIPSCVQKTNGESMAGPSGTYYFVRDRGRFMLLELNATGDGSAIDNYWRDQNGHNFVTYIKGRHGWHYIIPDERGKPGTRIVYVKGMYQPQKTGGIIRLLGEPAATCELVPVGSSPTPVVSATAPPPPPVAPPPATTSPPTGPIAGCQGDSDCKGGRVCHQGACVAVSEVPKCVRDVDCEGNLICKDGMCKMAPPPSTPTGSGCAKDIECKGNRVCVKGECVSP